MNRSTTETQIATATMTQAPAPGPTPGPTPTPTPTPTATAAPAPAPSPPPAEPAARRRHPHRQGRFRGTWLKAGAGVLLYRVAGILPAASFRLLLRALCGVLRLVRRVPGNPLMQVSADLARVARARGIQHDPRAIYHAFLDQVSAIGPLGLEVLSHGPQRAVARTRCPEEQVRLVQDLCREHGGLVVATGHYLGAVYASMWLSSVLPTVLVVKNQRLPRLEAISREVFGIMGVDVAFVRDLSALELSRTAIGALRKGKALVATLDLVDRQATAVPVSMFGADTGLGAWAYRFAIRAKVPVVPTHIRVRPDGIDVDFQDALPLDSPEEATRAFGRFLERNVLREPATWAMILDKRWRAVLRAGARALGPG